VASADAAHKSIIIQNTLSAICSAISFITRARAGRLPVQTRGSLICLPLYHNIHSGCFLYQSSFHH
jgi:hypothetical protein